MKNILIVTTASEKIGLGHLIRSLSLAGILNSLFNISFVVNTDDSSVITLIKSEGYTVHTIAAPDSIINFELLSSVINKADIMVLDFYAVTEELQQAIKMNNLKLVCIDDLHRIHFYADVVMNVSNSVTRSNYRCENYTKLLLGTDYVLLRTDFLKNALRPARSFKAINSVFINMGGSDLPNNTLKFLKVLRSIKGVNEVHIVLGVINPHKNAITDYIKRLTSTLKVFVYYNISSFELIEILLRCQVAICPASGISMELCAVGIGIITGYTADNQKDLLKGLIDRKCAFDLGDLNAISKLEIVNSINSILVKLSTINDMIINQKNIVDGNSPERIRSVFKTL